MKNIINAHIFFVKQTPKFIGVWSSEYYTKFLHPSTVYCGRYILSLRQKLYYPIAYIKFMYYSIKQ